MFLIYGFHGGTSTLLQLVMCVFAVSAFCEPSPFLVSIPCPSKERDDLLFAPVATKCEGQSFRGMIMEVKVNRSRERLYLVRSADGDCHMNENQARSAMAAWATDLEADETLNVSAGENRPLA